MQKSGSLDFISLASWKLTWLTDNHNSERTPESSYLYTHLKNVNNLLPQWRSFRRWTLSCAWMKWTQTCQDDFLQPAKSPHIHSEAVLRFQDIHKSLKQTKKNNSYILFD